MPRKSKRLSHLRLSRLFPNVLTLLGLCAGLSAMRYALLERWELSVALIVLAALLDSMDGRVARMLNATSTFGAQLDSLVDFVNFGIVPAFILYLWQLEAIPVRGIGWGVLLLYTICSAIRLARFNTDLEDDEKPAWMDYFFVGIPMPAGALLILTPLMLFLEFEVLLFGQPIFLALYIAIVAILMASRVPTFSAKRISIPRELVSLLLVLVGLCLVGLVMEPWLVLPLLGIVYFVSIPFSVIYFYHLRRTESK